MHVVYQKLPVHLPANSIGVFILMILLMKRIIWFFIAFSSCKINCCFSFSPKLDHTRNYYKIHVLMYGIGQGMKEVHLHINVHVHDAHVHVYRNHNEN